ncbi:hypothetical protein [Acidovorax sp.]|uniref:hypothetical protein n=1 Tax=Acidovorax sp. TaxID=1872122 RepID=UPI002ACEA21F|nr:hypothetical protein [Acidovorax sp.]MDZ7863527.1 hypothetical protein [Acidovorax sp.]
MNSPEAEAFNRWQKKDFQQVEHEAASDWRSMLTNLNLPEVGRRMRALGITPQTCRSVKDASGLAKGLVHSRHEPEDQIALLFSFVNIPHHLQGNIIDRWSKAGFPPLAVHAPYAAHVLMVEIFFQIALAANLISTERASNRVDIAYLFYLPFCHVFVSGDKLHKLCAPEFLTKQQDFVWAPDLKSDLARMNREMLAASEVEREAGLHNLAPRPLGDDSNLTVALWNRHAPGSPKSKEVALPMSPEAERKLVEHLQSFTKAPTAPDVASVPSDDLDSISIERLVPAKKGSWWLIPKEIAKSESGKRD